MKYEDKNDFMSLLLEEARLELQMLDLYSKNVEESEAIIIEEQRISWRIQMLSSIIEDLWAYEDLKR